MDLSLLEGALSSRSYHTIAHICDDLMLHVAADGISFPTEWPYAIHLLGHFYIGNINSARFLWKLIPTEVKDSQPELVATWRIGQKLWTRDYAGVYEAIRSFNWGPQTQPIVAAFSENYTKKMFLLLLDAYSTISVQDTALFLGMGEDDATQYALEEGWIMESTTRMLTVKKHSIVAKQKLDSAKLHRLTEYVFQLEH